MTGDPALRRLTTTIAVATGSAVAGGAVVAVLHPAPAAVVGFSLAILLGTASSVLGLLVAHHRPEHPVGAMLALVGLAPAVVLLLDGVAALPGAPTSAAGRLLTALDDGIWVLWYLPVAVLVLCFPTGRPQTRLDSRLLVALLVDSGLFLVVATADAHPGLVMAEPWAGLVLVLQQGSATTLLVLLLACFVQLGRRYRRADPVPRAQIAWLLLTAAALPITLASCWVGYLLVGEPDAFVLVGLVVLYLSVPVATALAVLRHDFLEIDRAIAAALTYALVSVVVVLVFSLVVVVGGEVAGRGSTLPAVLATLAAVLVLAPVRRRAHDVVDRRLLPARQAALTALEGFREDLSAGRVRPEALGDVLRAALRDDDLVIGFQVPGGIGEVDVLGQPLPRRTGAVPVRIAGEAVGSVTGGATTGPSLLRDVANTAAPLVELVRLRIELRQALAEVDASRSRLLRVGYQERRRLERDLHDGAQQRLVSLGMALRLGQRRLTRGPIDVDGLLDQAVAELSTAVAELRRTAHGLRPGALDAGLLAALRSLVSIVPEELEVRVESDGDVPPDLGDDIGTTAYYVASEAVTNAVKHAGATRIELHLRSSADELRLHVVDDGVGGAVAAPGSGLAGLADRVVAQGGRLAVHSPLEGGTRVEAVLPCGS